MGECIFKQKTCLILSRAKVRKKRASFFHPDYTVGSGIPADRQVTRSCSYELAGFTLRQAQGITAGGEYHLCLNRLSLTQRSVSEVGHPALKEYLPR